MTTSQLSHYGYADLEALTARMTGDEKHGPAATSMIDACR
jgi:transketolase